MHEIKNSINWYLVKINKSIAVIEDFKLPANHEEVRFQYSILIESLFSLIDYLEDKKVIFKNNKFDIEGRVKTEIGFDGGIIVDYMRELRNSIIHRGADPTSAGSVVNDRIVILAPEHIFSRHGSLMVKPNEVFLDKLIAILDDALKNVTKFELRKLNALEENNSSYINELALLLKSSPIPFHAPDEVKMMIKSFFENTSNDEFLSMATAMYNSSLANLISNLSVRVNTQHLSY